MTKITQQKIADNFGVSQKMVSRWKQQGAPLDDFQALCKWLRLNRQRMPKELKAGIKRMERIATKGVTQRTSPVDETDRKTLEDFRDYYVQQLNFAAKADLADEVKHWNDLLLKTEKCIRESEAHIKKLGIEKGEMMPREEIERIIRAMIYGGNACVRAQVKEIAEVLAAESSPAEIYEMLSPAILGGRIFEGLKVLTKSESQVSLPIWVVKCFQSEGENYLQGIDLIDAES
jgi:transcriptional regulator with XRE-family HTH domain